ncbi:hypothetical protein ACFQJD_09370 [Haloplanus sp. GCM10025708]|uniref:DUF7344 domain-containing protein n=1 Tax=Haloferacaceae TaxID=1644056 RepID=UPI00360E668C
MPHSDSIGRTGDAVSTLQLLANQRRVHLLDALDASGGATPFRELAVEVAAREADGGEPSDDHLDRVRTALFHNHLPQLDDANLVEFDAEDRRVCLADDRRLTDLADAILGE